MHQYGKASRDDTDPRVDLPSDLRRPLVCLPALDPEDEGDDSENEAGQRNDAEDTRVVRGQGEGVFVRDNPAGSIGGDAARRGRKGWGRRKRVAAHGFGCLITLE